MFKKGCNNLTPEQIKEAHEKSSETIRNLPPEKKAVRGKNISDAKIAKNKEKGSPIHNPELWKLSCSNCKEDIIFEKYHQWQNTKSSIKKGNKKLCENCRLKNTKRSNVHRDEWTIECNDKDCSNIIQYENLPAYGQALKRIEEGTPKYCDECRENKHPKKNGPGKMYSNNPEDWQIKCKFDDCYKILTYNSYGAYAHNCKRILKGDPPMCYSCAGKHWERTEEYLDKLRGRVQTEETKIKFKETCASRTEEEKLILSEKHSIVRKEIWANYTEEEREARGKISADNLNNLSPEKRIERNKLMSYYAKLRSKDQFKNGTWQPWYNKASIPFIVDILNIRYNTEFRHAENGGEFKLYDEQFDTHYFADAYCSKLNMWIEFDEPYHFKRGILREECLIREDRIRECLPGIIIHRIYFDKKNHNNIN